MDVRNLFGFKPPIFSIDLNKKNLSTSDAFFWRTDSGYSTIFKYSDILNLFFKTNNSKVSIMFYDKNNNLIKTKRISELELSNTIILDKFFFDGLEDYGVFYIFHETSKEINSAIRNSCYTGYSLNKNLASFVHGNLITGVKTFDGNSSIFGIIGSSKLRKNTYKIQNFYNFDKTEIAIMNPTKKKLEIVVNDQKILLETCCSKIVNIGKNQTIKIISNCYLLRPIIFNYQSHYIDVYHG